MPEASSHLPASLDLTRPGIIEASAGTGKTFTIAEIYLSLLRGEKTFSPGNPKQTFSSDETFSAPRVREILVVTFTDAATAELRSRLRKNVREAIAENPENEKIRTALQLADAEFDEASVFTIHGFCLRVLKDFGISARTEEIRASLSDELLRFATRWRARKIAAGENIFFSVEAAEICSVLQPFLQNPELVPAEPNPADERACALYAVATQALEEWTLRRERAKDISYGEILITLRDALRDDPKLAARISARYRVAVVDEFQDTDPVQWEIFRNLFLSRNKPIFCVGDPKQAIYEFRGGDIRIYRKAKREILAAGNGNALTLGENWRSEPTVIDAFNEIFSFDSQIPATVDLGTAKKPFSVPAEISGLLDYSPVAFPQKKLSEAGNDFFDTKRKTVAAYIKIEDDESSKERGKENVRKHIAADIEDLVIRRGVPASDIAILVSDNDEANLYRAELGKKNIPAATTARGNVLCEPIARSLADILHAMLEPQNTARFRRAIISPFFEGIDANAISGNETSEFSDAARQAFADARTRWEKSGILSAFQKLSETLQFFSVLAKQKSATAQVTNLLHLTEILHNHEQKSALSPRALTRTFDALLASAKRSDDAEELRLRADSDSDAVNILTIHKSKGLEFDTVFVPSLWAKPLYSKRGEKDFVKSTGKDGNAVLLFDSSKDKSREFLTAALEAAGANAACLFYVALTRARSRLVLYHVPQRRSREIWNSYQNQILGVALPKLSEAGTHSAWQILPAGTPLPDSAFPENAGFRARSAQAKKTGKILSPEEAETRFAQAEEIRKKLSRETESVFSFSKIIHASENEPAGFLRDDEGNPTANDVPETAVPATSSDEKTFPKKHFFDLPSGAEFGTLAHLIFEKTDFRSRENLPELVNSALDALPNRPNATPREQEILFAKFCAMTEENLRLPLFSDENFRLASLPAEDAVHEMEFHFPLKQSRDIYPELFRIFKNWGGIYAETADYHWAPTSPAKESSLRVAGMMTGIIDLVFRTNGKFFILDWKTNSIAPPDVPADFRLSESELRREIVRHGYALQWSIYALALRKFLKQSLGENYVHDRDFGGIVYLFVRWCIPFSDTKNLTDAKLDELDRILGDR